MKNNVVILLLGFLISCKVCKKASVDIQKSASTTMLNYHKLDQDFLNGYDSVIFFKDIDLANLKGEFLLGKDSLSYPFIALKYKENTIELVSFLNDADIKKWVIKKESNHWYSTFKYRESRPPQDEYVTLIFGSNNQIISLYTTEKKISLNDFVIKPRIIIYEKRKNLNEVELITYRYLQKKSNLTLSDVVEVNKAKLDSSYLEYSLERKRIKGNKLYSLNYQLIDLRTMQDIQNRRKAIEIQPSFLYSSFFYYFIHDQTAYYTNVD
jgi:hypothetical protein